MSLITINTIGYDNIINFTEYQLDLTISGTVEDISIGTTLSLELDGKTITTTVQSGLIFSFTIPNDFVSSSNELYVQQLKDKTPYIIKVSGGNISSYKAFYVDLSTSVMSYNNFVDGAGAYQGLPQDGDIINAQNVNYGPIQNREDLLLLDSKIGDVSSIIDQKSSTYLHNQDNDLENPNASISNAISQLRVDIGDKNLLMTSAKYNLVSAINELQENMYRPANALSLVAKYDHQTNGNYVLSGGNVTYVKQLIKSELPAANILARTQPYQTKRDASNDTTTSAKYNQFTISPSKILLKGYETIIPKSLDFYFQDTMEDTQRFHKKIYEDDIVMRKVSTRGANHVFKILYMDSYFNGIYSIQSIEGLKTYEQNFTFTTNGNSFQQLDSTLKNYITTNYSLTFSSVKLESIPSSLLVNGVVYKCELDVNGYGIKWTNSTPPAGFACIIPSGTLIYKGVFDDNTLPAVASISSTKDSILLSGAVSFKGNVANISFYRITPRYDRIYVSVKVSDYNSNYWDSNITYDTNDIVIYNGHSFKSLISNNFNVTPVSGVKWKDLGLTYEGVTTQPVFVYKEGYNNKQGYPVIPTISDDNSLVLCTILFVYGRPPVIKNEYVNTFKMTDIKKIEDTLNDAVYNLARLSLTQNLTLADQNLTKNIFVEPFFDNDLRDTVLELAHVDSSSPSSMFINNGYLTHSVSFTESNELISSSNEPFIQLDSSEVISTPMVEQNLYSRSVLINKYQVTTPPKVRLTVTPQSFTWFDKKQINNFKERNATLNGVKVDYSSVSSIVNKVTSSTSTVDNGWSTTTTVTTTSTSVSDVVDKRTETISSIIKEPRKVPVYQLTIKAPNYSFNGGEQLKIQLGELPEFFGEVSGVVLKADNNGAINHTFTIGGDIKPLLSGDRILSVEGIGMPDTPANDYISGARGTAIVTQTPFLKIINNYDIINRTVISTSNSTSNTSWNFNGGDGGDGGDPLAQTFVSPKSTYLHSVYFMVDAINGTNSDYNVETSDKVVNETILAGGVLPEDLEVTLFGTTAGYPDIEKILAKGVLPKGTVINQLSPAYSKVELFPKVKLEKDETYSFCVAGPFESYSRMKKTSSTTWAVGIGQDNIRLKLRSVKLGERYPNPGAKNKLYNSQKYIGGVMLSSSNMATWNAHQDEDLCFKVTKSLFSVGPKNVNFDSKNTVFTNVTDLVLQVGKSTPARTNVSHILKYGSSGSLTQTIDLQNGEHRILSNKIPSINIHQLQCTLSTSETPKNGLVTETPVLYKEASILFGTVDPVSVYVTQNIDLTGGALFSEEKKLRVYLDVLNYNSNRMKVYYTTDDEISSGSWVLMYNDTAYEGPSSEKRFFADSLDTAIDLGNFLRIKIVLKTNINNNSEISTRIGVKNLRVFAH